MRTERITRTGDRRTDRLTISLPIANDPTVFVSAPVPGSDDDDRDTIHVRCRGDAGFIPHYLFEKAMRWMKNPRRNELPPPAGIQRLADDEYKFYSAKVTVIAKRVRDGVAMHAVIDLRDNPERRVITRKFNSVTCEEILSVIKVAAAVLVFFNVETVRPEEIHSDERTWLESFSGSYDGCTDVSDGADVENDNVASAPPASNPPPASETVSKEAS